MTTAENIEKLTDARDKTAEVYESEAIDEKPDNGNLTTLNTVILGLNNAIKNISSREEG